MSEKIVSIRENESLRSATVNAVDALDRVIDAVWGLIAIIEILDRESRDNHYANGALRIAHNHLDALIAIRRGLGGVSAPALSARWRIVRRHAPLLNLFLVS